MTAGNTRRCNSFILGVAFASLTWTISLVLYSNLTQENSTSPAPGSVVSWSVPPLPNPYRYKSPPAQRDQNMIEQNEQQYEGKSAHVKSNPRMPSAKLLSQLQPKKFENELGMVKSPEDQRIRDEGYKNHAFNVLVSHKLEYHRTIPDTRHHLCQEQVYPEKLPTASIVICFYNEDLITLLRSVHSVLDRTPEHLLHEILLVDDNSDISGLHSDLVNYVRKHLSLKVVVTKTHRREGLIRARMFGARMATGEVLVFLDSHVEVNKEWLQPLLARIAAEPHSLVTPVIDIINADTFQYTSSPLVRGGFNWGLHFKWENVPEGQLQTDADFIKPIRSPTMAGGLFAMNKTYFEKLGAYDSGMNIWGGENLEISFRVWMCGGTLEILPCSRVGHVFRRRRPYGAPDGEDTMTHNSLRVAHVWMDEFKDYFFQVRPDARKLSYGDISSRLKLREELACKSFAWYLKNIYPELALPQSESEKARLQHKWQAINNNNNNHRIQPWHSRKRNYVAQYQIQLAGTSLCIQSDKDVKSKGSLLSLQPCLRIKTQVWYETDRKELVLGQLLCLDASDNLPRLAKCHEMGSSQEWRHHEQPDTPIYNMAAGTCLGVNESRRAARVTMELCTRIHGTKWHLVSTSGITTR